MPPSSLLLPSLSSFLFLSFLLLHHPPPSLFLCINISVFLFFHLLLFLYPLRLLFYLFLFLYLSLLSFLSPHSPYITTVRSSVSSYELVKYSNTQILFYLRCSSSFNLPPITSSYYCSSSIHTVPYSLHSPSSTALFVFFTLPSRFLYLPPSLLLPSLSSFLFLSFLLLHHPLPSLFLCINISVFLFFHLLLFLYPLRLLFYLFLFLYLSLLSFLSPHSPYITTVRSSVSSYELVKYCMRIFCNFSNLERSLVYLSIMHFSPLFKLLYLVHICFIWDA